MIGQASLCGQLLHLVCIHLAVDAAHDLDPKAFERQGLGAFGVVADAGNLAHRVLEVAALFDCHTLCLFGLQPFGCHLLHRLHAVLAFSMASAIK